MMNPKLMLQQANLLASEERFEEAVVILEQLLQMEPALVAAHMKLAVTLKQAGRMSEAINEYRNTFNLDADNEEVISQLGLLLESEGRNEEAIEYYGKCLVRTPSAGLHNRLALVLDEVGRHNEALAEYDKAISLEPGNPLWHLNLGVVLAEVGRKQDAIRAFRAALLLEPNHIVVLENLAITLEEMGKIQEAEEVLREIIQLPQDVSDYPDTDSLDADYGADYNATYLSYLSEAHFHLALLMEQKGQLEQALTELRLAVLLQPKDPRFNNQLGVVLDKMGLKDEAQAARKRAAQWGDEKVND